jgi:hypothetical protein
MLDQLPADTAAPVDVSKVPGRTMVNRLGGSYTRRKAGLTPPILNRLLAVPGVQSP